MRGLAVILAATTIVACGDQTPQSHAAAHALVPTPATKEDFGRAADALLAEIGEPGQRVSMPEADDPVTQRFLVQARGLTESLGTSAQPAASLEEFDSICGKGTKVLITYGLAGLSTQVNKDTNQSEVAAIAQRVMGENFKKYFTVFFPTMLFNQHCTSAYMPAAERLFTELPTGQFTPARAEGLRKVRRGVLEAIQGALTIASDPGITAKGRGIILTQLETDWDGLVLALPAAERTNLAAGIAKLSATFPADERARVAKLALRVSDVKCSALCSIP